MLLQKSFLKDCWHHDILKPSPGLFKQEHLLEGTFSEWSAQEVHMKTAFGAHQKPKKTEISYENRKM